MAWLGWTVEPALDQVDLPNLLEEGQHGALEGEEHADIHTPGEMGQLGASFEERDLLVANERGGFGSQGDDGGIPG